MFTQPTIITVSEDTTPDNFAQHAAEGKVQFHRERGNGTTRRVHFLQDGSKPREWAEWVRAQREDGRTMRQIANETHFSIPTLRRWLNDLALTEAVEEADEDELSEMLTGAADLATEPEVLVTPDAPAEQTPVVAEQAPEQG